MKVYKPMECKVRANCGEYRVVELAGALVVIDRMAVITEDLEPAQVLLRHGLFWQTGEIPEGKVLMQDTAGNYVVLEQTSCGLFKAYGGSEVDPETVERWIQL